jgi:putative ABC transport system permease protein
MNLAVAVSRSMTQLRTNPLRTFLTLLGVVFGVGSVVAMVSIGEGAQRQILEMIDAMGATNVHVIAHRPSDTEIADVVNDSAGLTQADVAAALAVAPDVRGAAFRKKHDLRSTDLALPMHEIEVFGVSERLMGLHGLAVKAGRPLTAPDHLSSRRVAVLGAALARRAFGGAPVGRVIRLDFAYFEIVGVLAEIRAVQGDLPVDPTAYDDAILVPYSAMIEELEPVPEYGELDLITLEGTALERTSSIKTATQAVLSTLHGRVADFEVVAPEEILEQKEATQRVLNIVLISIAAISLIVGGIGVMNIMLANIMERIGEIGLRRALGARRRDIRNQFLEEAVLICFVGGAIGIALGFGLSFGVAFLFDLKVAFAWEAMLLSFAIASAVGVGFGYMPAKRAAEIDPIDALRDG